MTDYTIPRANAPIAGQEAPTIQWYNYLRGIGASTTSSNAALLADITIISDKLGSTDGTPENIPPLSNITSIDGIDSVSVTGANIKQIKLVNDVGTASPVSFYGSNSSGIKGWYAVSSAFLGAPGNVNLTVGPTGITTIDLAPVENSGIGSLLATTRDSFGRVTGTKSATITGASNRITVTNGDAVSGLPTIDISSSYVGQASITTLGNIASGTWNAASISAAHGGTGQSSYTMGDILYANTTSSIARIPIGSNGTILRVAAGIPSWGADFSGTVTSVGLSLPSQLSVTGTPVTSSGTLAASWNSQAVNSIFAGPSTGSAGAPSFRAMVTSDMPVSGVVAGIYGSVTQFPQVTFNAQGQATAASNITIPTLASGIYTPTVSSVANLGSVSANSCQYLRVGSVVTVSGSINATPTLALGTITTASITLPVASTLANANECAGSCSFTATATAQDGYVWANVAADRANLTWTSTLVSSGIVYFHLTYRII